MVLLFGSRCRVEMGRVIESFKLEKFLKIIESNC